ncbi:TlpA family protein disulfide reductase [Algibacter sp. L1A34]|uniref:TlpA family protein disulfide reductase n=1 Tax=Algibacter sp. L1A34 TaxID=2686365 RepID=UPI00131E177E|nr:TlpA disulfide reductase family protein [Algibacter sp. L1A34]
MKKLLLITLSLFLFLSCKKTDKEILNETISQLTSITNIEYDVIIENVNKSHNQNIKESATCYFDFSSKDTLIGSKYHFNVNNYGEQVFNGKQEFSSQNKEELVLYNEYPNKRQVSSSMFMFNSFFTLRKILPEIIQDSTIKIGQAQDTILLDKECYKFDILMKGKFIGIGGEILKGKKQKLTDSINYVLFISKKDYLPIRFGNIQPKNQGHNYSTFSNYKIPNTKNDSIWNYSRFPKEYLRSTYNDYYDGLRKKNKNWIGTEAPDWELSDLEEKPIKFSNLDKNMVLLEFWFPYCGGCVQATPILNEIQKNYKDKGLSIYGIEFTNTPAKALLEYSEKQNVEISTLYNGKNVSKDYGVYAAPTFFLIDKKGEIIYTSVGLNKEKLIEEIEKNI